jgi:hypothetical protein
MFSLLQSPNIQTLLVPICFISAWSLILLTLWNSWKFVWDTVNQASQMHKIPCASCQFFTGDYRLKCTLHPSIALTEDAIHCPDYQLVNPYRVQKEVSLEKP